MRPVQDGDLIALARVAMLWPEARRAARLERALAQADAADWHRIRRGRMHPKWGNGSLMSWALDQPAGPRDPNDGCYLEALRAVCTALLAYQSARN
ncbi:hypothetical protein FGG78_13460 [Thioclava sp. BHET1]|nr:hypothetical protein FGG78_13460 [Thioclava sp. BHET1]